MFGIAVAETTRRMHSLFHAPVSPAHEQAGHIDVNIHDKPRDDDYLLSHMRCALRPTLVLRVSSAPPRTVGGFGETLACSHCLCVDYCHCRARRSVVPRLG